jgi:hypothetical protein
VLAELRKHVGRVEAERAAARQRTGRRVCGRHAVFAQSWRGQPVNREPRRNLRPRVAAPNEWAQIEALLRLRAGLHGAPGRDGVQVLFPPGTSWLRRFAYVPGPVAET